MNGVKLGTLSPVCISHDKLEVAVLWISSANFEWTPAVRPQGSSGGKDVKVTTLRWMKGMCYVITEKNTFLRI